MHTKKLLAMIIVLSLVFTLVLTGCESIEATAAETESTEVTKSNAPDGAMPEGEGPGGERPEGEGPGGERPEGEGPGGGMGQGQMQGGQIEYTGVAAYETDDKVSGQEINSEGKDESAVLVTGGDVTLSDMTISRESSESTGGDQSSFYGVGAAVLTTGGVLDISDSEITTDAAGGAGVFAYGDGTAYVTDCNIYTEQGTSGGIHVAGGGTLYADNVNAETNGESSAAVRSDRGGGLIVVTGGSYTSNGTGSPAVYSTANIVAKEAELTATGSEAVCIEGMNSLYLYDCSLSGSMKEDEQNDCTWNVILYQSMSGDSKEGNSTFQMEDGTLTANNGGMFYTTNTQSTFVLKNVELIPAEDNSFLLKVTGNSNARGWGKTGENGADCSFTAIDQDLTGNVIWDSVSTLDLYLTADSTLTGAFLQNESNAGEGGEGYAKLIIDEDSTWIVTADSTLTGLSCAGEIVDSNGNKVSVVGTDGTEYVKGTGNVTVTVDSFDTEPDLTGAGTIVDFEDAQVNNGYEDEGMGGMPGDGGQPPEMGEGGMGENGETPPEKPDGEMQGGMPGGGGQPPEKPDGEEPPEKPDN